MNKIGKTEVILAFVITMAIMFGLYGIWALFAPVTQ